MPVAAPVELHDPLTARGRASHPHGAHHRLGTRVHEPHPLHARDGPAQALTELYLPRGGCPEATAVRHRRLRGLHHRGVGVAQDQRTPRAHAVHVAAALHVHHIRAHPSHRKRRRAPYRAEGAHGAAATPRHHLPRPLEQGFGGQPHRRCRAASLAKYVRIQSAPARRTDSRTSIMADSRSSQPRCAAACTMAYSPLTQ